MKNEAQNEERNLIKKMQISVRVFVVAVILTITFFLLFIDGMKSFSSAVTILVMPKSEVSAISQVRILNNISQFPKTVSFYDRLLQNNPDVRDVANGKSQAEKIKIWSKLIRTEKVDGNSSMIKLTATARNENDSIQLSQKAVRNLIDFTGNYYDIKNEVDIRIVDGPITRVHIVGWEWMLLASLILGAGIAVILQFIFHIEGGYVAKKTDDFLKNNPLSNLKKMIVGSPENKIQSLDQLYEAEQADSNYVENNFPTEVPEDIAEEEIPWVDEEESLPVVDEKFAEVKRVTKMLEPSKYPNFPEMPVHNEQKASAPDNLPIADDSFLAYDEGAVAPVEQKAEEKVHGEPTADDLKKRLNQLLKGE